MPSIDITFGEYRFLQDYGKFHEPRIASDRAAYIGLRALIEEHITRDHAFGRDGEDEALADLGHAR